MTLHHFLLELKKPIGLEVKRLQETQQSPDAFLSKLLRLVTEEKSILTVFTEVLDELINE